MCFIIIDQVCDQVNTLDNMHWPLTFLYRNLLNVPIFLLYFVKLWSIIDFLVLFIIYLLNLNYFF